MLESFVVISKVIKTSLTGPARSETSICSFCSLPMKHSFYSLPCVAKILVHMCVWYVCDMCVWYVCVSLVLSYSRTPIHQHVCTQRHALTAVLHFDQCVSGSLDMSGYVGQVIVQITSAGQEKTCLPLCHCSVVSRSDKAWKKPSPFSNFALMA